MTDEGFEMEDPGKEGGAIEKQGIPGRGRGYLEVLPMS